MSRVKKGMIFFILRDVGTRKMIMAKELRNLTTSNWAFSFDVAIIDIL